MTRLFASPGRRKRPEAALQVAVMQYLALALPNTAVAFHPANEGRRSARAGADLKRQGLLPGLPDVFVLWRGSVYAIELKAGKGRVSAQQTATHKRLVAAGCPVSVCRSIDDVEAFLTLWRFPLAARAAA